MLTKTLTIDGQEVKFKSSAAITRLYRAKFNRDILRDMDKLQKSFVEYGSRDGKGASSIPVEDLEIFENVAYIMAYHADPTIPDTIDEWLEQFNMFSIYSILPELLELWGNNLFSDVPTKKNNDQPTES